MPRNVRGFKIRILEELSALCPKDGVMRGEYVALVRLDDRAEAKY